MKKFTAIIFSLALLLAGLPLSAATLCADQPAKNCCNCGGKSACCAIKDGSTPADKAPAAPAPTTASVAVDFFAVAWHCVSTLPLPDKADGKVSATTPVALASSSAVPLFTRDCAFLI